MRQKRSQPSLVIIHSPLNLCFGVLDSIFRGRQLWLQLKRTGEGGPRWGLYVAAPTLHPLKRKKIHQCDLFGVFHPQIVSRLLEVALNGSVPPTSHYLHATFHRLKAKRRCFAPPAVAAWRRPTRRAGGVANKHPGKKKKKS